MTVPVIPSFVDTTTTLTLLLVGVSGSGKSTTCASLLREKTLLLYLKSAEEHSPRIMQKGTCLFPGANPENLLAMAIDRVEQPDKGFLPFVEKSNVGDKLAGDQAFAKLIAYIKAAKELGVSYVVIDSLAGVFSIIRSTKRFADMCKTGKGDHDNFKESPSYINLYDELHTLFGENGEQGVGTVCILGAKTLPNPNGGESAIQPELPMFSVAHHLPFRFPDILITSTREIEGAEEFRTVLDFGLSIERKGTDVKTKAEKFINIKPRLAFMPPTLTNIVSWLPPDLLQLKENIAEYKKALG